MGNFPFYKQDREIKVNGLQIDSLQISSIYGEVYFG